MKEAALPVIRTTTPVGLFQVPEDSQADDFAFSSVARCAASHTQRFSGQCGQGWTTGPLELSQPAQLPGHKGAIR